MLFVDHILSLSEIILEPGTDLTQVLIGYVEVTSGVYGKPPIVVIFQIVLFCMYSWCM